MISAHFELSKKQVESAFNLKSLADTCKKFKSEIVMSRGESFNADGHSVSDLYEFSSLPGRVIDILVEGKDELVAMGALYEHFNYGTGI